MCVLNTSTFQPAAWMAARYLEALPMPPLEARGSTDAASTAAPGLTDCGASERVRGGRRTTKGGRRRRPQGRSLPAGAPLPVAAARGGLSLNAGRQWPRHLDGAVGALGHLREGAEAGVVVVIHEVHQLRLVPHLAPPRRQHPPHVRSAARGGPGGPTTLSEMWWDLPLVRPPTLLPPLPPEAGRAHFQQPLWSSLAPP